jgi:hypothetical protein
MTHSSSLRRDGSGGIAVYCFPCSVRTCRWRVFAGARSSGERLHCWSRRSQSCTQGQQLGLEGGALRHSRTEQLDGLLQQPASAIQPGRYQWLAVARPLPREHAAIAACDEAISAYDLSAVKRRGDFSVSARPRQSDETALTGRAGQLFDCAFARAPNHPKALWYSSMAALQAGDLRKVAIDCSCCSHRPTGSCARC